MKSKRCSRSSTEGYSLTEVLVAMVIVLTVTGAALSFALSSRKIYEKDQARTELNQNLRIGADFLVTDLRQAGERLPEVFPAVEILRGEDLPSGQPGDPDRLIVRRNLLDTVLLSCRDVTSGTTQIHVVENIDVDSPPGCDVPVPDDDGDGWPENVQRWREYRLDRGPVLRAYLYNPVTQQGEFFNYVNEQVDNGVGGQEVYLIKSGAAWQNDCLETDGCRVYLLEERRYEIDADDELLQLVINGDEANPVHLVDRIVDFQALALFQDGTQQESFGAADVFEDLRAIEVTLFGRTTVRDEILERTWSGEIMPRNVLSR